MQAILYIGHGSRVKEGIEEANLFIKQVKSKISIPIQEICFLELVSPTIAEGIANCVARGATSIAIVPVLLLSAHHVKKDIPLEIEAGKARYPEVKFIYGKPFGIHSKIIDSLYDRILEQDRAIDERTSVLLVGRGSSDPAVKHDLLEIAKQLSDKYAIKQVDVCFLYGAKPSFNEALKTLQKKDLKQIFVIPYLLFSGLLMNEITSKIVKQSTADQTLILCENLGYHKNMQKVLLERIDGVLGHLY
ncbi:sirohydrochlorin chelatase [Amphibacillus sp. MSJ-3]|nr:sirohydrochlorin chelatase [Amphibacillus sp. MSJ-3]